MRVRRCDIVDEYVEDDRAAIFVGDMVLALSELATSAWLVIGPEWTPVETVTQALLGEYGAPPPPATAEGATRGVLEDLSERDLVELDEDPETESSQHGVGHVSITDTVWTQ